MGAPVFSHKDFPSKPLILENILFNFVSMGNPHAVGFVKNVSESDLLTIGPRIENDPRFPNKINVEFVEKISDNHFKIRVWERGCGETMACGTGACAVYAIIIKDQVGQNFKQNEIILEFPGGKLYLSENEKREIILCGEAIYVFEGEI
jgi:diaminopimelate epimerase